MGGATDLAAATQLQLPARASRDNGVRTGSNRGGGGLNGGRGGGEGGLLLSDPPSSYSSAQPLPPSPGKVGTYGSISSPGVIAGVGLGIGTGVGTMSAEMGAVVQELEALKREHEVVVATLRHCEAELSAANAGSLKTRSDMYQLKAADQEVRCVGCIYEYHSLRRVCLSHVDFSCCGMALFLFP